MTDTSYETRRQRNLILGLVFDCIGMMSFSIPGIGEFADVIWAPCSFFLMAWMYKGYVGKIGGAVSFVEEILPFSDIVPTFTLTWVYTYFLSPDKGRGMHQQKKA